MNFFDHITKKAKVTFIAALFLNIVLVCLLIVTFYAVHAKKTDVASLKEEIAVQEERDRKLLILKKFVEDMHDELEIVDEYFVAGDEVVSFIEEIERVGRMSGVSISLRSVNIEKENPGGLSVSLIASGKWEHVYYFLEMLELFPAHIKINEAHLLKKERDEHDTWTGDFSFSLISFSEK